MKKAKLTQSVVFLIITFSAIEFTNASTEDLQKTHNDNYNSSISLESMIQKDLNCTDKSEGQLAKSRRKRYVAFPEGSSFSVETSKRIFFRKTLHPFLSYIITFYHLNYRLHSVLQLASLVIRNTFTSVGLLIGA